jgi:hypothetical protein
VIAALVAAIGLALALVALGVGIYRLVGGGE